MASDTAGSQQPDIEQLVEADEVDPIRAALGDDCPPDNALRRPVIEDDGRADVITARGSRSTAVVVFTGLAGRMTMSLPLFDRYLAELDLTAIYLRDRRRLGYFGGVESLGRDYDETLMRLKELAFDLGAHRAHTIGSSAGGIGAVVYGMDLRARSVLGFSAPTSLGDSVLEFDRRAVNFAQRLLRQVPADRRDLRARIQAAKSATRIDLYYGHAFAEDRQHAKALEGARGVSLHPVSGPPGRGALMNMALFHGLRPLFRAAFGDKD